MAAARLVVYTVGLRRGETKHGFGGVRFFGFNKRSSGHDIIYALDR
ncbi:hypothetical protein [Nostoc sp.]